MSTIGRILFWIPRILCILFAAFLSMFALDVFSEGYSFWETILALLIHLVPTYIIVIALIIAWRWEWVGSILFIGLGVFYIISSWGPSHWSTYLVIPGPLFLIGIFFLLNWIYKIRARRSQQK